jgi:hypothetical protein
MDSGLIHPDGRKGMQVDRSEAMRVAVPAVVKALDYIQLTVGDILVVAHNPVQGMNMHKVIADAVISALIEAGALDVSPGATDVPRPPEGR